MDEDLSSLHQLPPDSIIDETERENTFRKMTVKSALKCKNDCEFFGNREWDGYCSQCYKNLRNGIHTTAAPIDYESFSKFEEKKRHQTDKKSFKSFFKVLKSSRPNSSDSNLATTSSSSEKPLNQFFEKSLMFGEEVLTKLFHDVFVRDINTNVNKCYERAIRLMKRNASIDELTECIYDFYSAMQKQFESKLVNHCSEISEDQVSQLLQKTEKILMDKLYLQLFARVQSEEEENDLLLQTRIRKLNWVMASHLDVAINLRNPKTKDLLDKAITEIIELDSKHVPGEKLDAVHRCSKTIFEMLTADSDGCSVDAISCDQFLPALVFVVIRANPPLLQSNIKFITRFSIPEQVLKGESAYYFTNLTCAITFIEEICGRSLNMSEAEFNSYMNGEAQPPGYYQQSFLCEAFRILEANRQALAIASEKSAESRTYLDAKLSQLDRFTTNLELRCKEAIDSSVKVIHDCSSYQTFNEIEEEDLIHLPSEFQAQCRIQWERKRSNGRLIDIDNCDQEEEKQNENNNDLVDIFGIPSEPVTDSVITTTDEDIAMKLPPPLAPEVINRANK